MAGQQQHVGKAGASERGRGLARGLRAPAAARRPLNMPAGSLPVARGPPTLPSSPAPHPLALASLDPPPGRRHLYGDVYSSPGLDLRQKQLLTCAFLAEAAMPDQLFGHALAGLRCARCAALRGLRCVGCAARGVPCKAVAAGCSPVPSRRSAR